MNTPFQFSTNPISQRIINFTIITLGAGIIAMGVGARWYIDGLEAVRKTREAEAQNEMAAQIQHLRSSITTLQYTSDALVQNNQAVAKKLEEEKNRRIAAESQRTIDQQKLSRLQQDLDSSRAPDLGSIIASWRPRVAQVRCRWELPSGAVVEGAGSGVLMTGNPVTLYTNRHVVTHSGYNADRCTIIFPDESIFSVVTSDNITLSNDGEDWAKIVIKKPSSYVNSLAATNGLRCSATATVGSPIIILGYPSIGARNDVTATEGIVSAIEGSFYISSAKVERGNSGGAAILTKQNCYLGIPSFVDAGELETLARILDQNKIGK